MAKVKVIPRSSVKHSIHPQLLHSVELLECPLCIEPLDATDRDFWPCPCGYQVCLFCYQRLQSEYNNTCPGCRQQYSDDLEGVRQHIARKQLQQKAEASTATRGVASHAVGSSHHPHHHASHHGTHGSHTAAAAAAARGKAGASTAKQRAGHTDATPHGRTAASAASEAASSSLPPTASWAVPTAAGGATAASTPDPPPPPPPHQQQQQQQHEPPPAATGYDSAWPSLGAAQQQQQVQAVPAVGNGHQRRRSSSNSLNAAGAQQQQQQQQADTVRSSFESTASTHTAHSEWQQRQQPQQAQRSDSDAQSSVAMEQQAPDQQQQQLQRNSSGFTTVEVSTVVGGKRHDVCVHVSHAEEVTAYPEAAVLLDMLQQAVHSSKLSSTEAAVQLVQCLRKLEADSSVGSSSSSSKQGSWLQQVLAAKGSNGTTPHSSGRPPLASRAPPPGFDVSTTPSKAPSGGGANGLSQLPPAGWSSAQCSTPQQQQQQQAAPGETPQSSMHSVDSTNSLFSQGSALSQSVWTDNGLPGVDLGVSRLTGGLTTGLNTGTAAVPARLQMLWSNAAPNGLNGSASSSSAVTGPPPGFGAAAGGGVGPRLNGTYNPLSFANAGQQDAGGLPLPPGFGLSGLAAAAEGAKQQQPSLYQPF